VFEDLQKAAREEMHSMFKIGDFSKLSQVSVKALRYYDELGLLKPGQIDRFTGYRYYSADQLPRLNRVLALKDLGLSLEQIARLLNDSLSLAQLRGMLKLKQAEIEQTIDEEQARLARVEARLRQIEQEDNMSTYDVVIKKVAPQRVAAIRDIIPTYADQGRLWQELEGYLAQQRVAPAAPCLTIYYDTEYKERDVDAEVCEVVDGALPGSERVSVRELPGVEAMACVVHHGPFNTLNQAYAALMNWIQANGYRIVGPDREVYLHSSGRQDDPSCVTEVQFPVEKA
jgi:effector-binding domain-containing protein